MYANGHEALGIYMPVRRVVAAAAAAAVAWSIVALSGFGLLPGPYLRWS